ncbi:transcription antitermination factor NusB [Aeromicrobium camelliae]|uniref:Transcription antitermination protein NusB n=1 Tax=Aeromicrobium camelliae TaxID=1538144 RepID=A0A3N6YCJ5_9ACTN|nr:transcription antitermination factor NusB [Aeromicrobium camelliae]RQN07534.1 transcription antitermination factor NusB [Aeromicrobium camelliae]
MGARTRYRKRALDILFESEARGGDLSATLADRMAINDPPINAYTVQLVEGVVAHQQRIDELLSEHSRGWTLDRMPAVDRNLLRIGAYEILYCEDVPDPVAVSEAVDLATDLSTDESPRFVNGLLSRLIDLKPTLSL